MRIGIPEGGKGELKAIERIIPEVCERGSIPMSCLNPAGSASTEKKVLQRNDIGTIM